MMRIRLRINIKIQEQHVKDRHPTSRKGVHLIVPGTRVGLFINKTLHDAIFHAGFQASSRSTVPIFLSMQLGCTNAFEC